MSYMLKRLLEPATDALASYAGRDGRSRYFPLINLGWLVWVFADVLLGGRIDHSWYVATAISLPVFLLLYLHAYTRSRRQVGFYALAMVVLGYAVLPWNHSGGSCYVIYACGFCAFIGSPRQSIASVLFVVAGFLVWSHLQDWPPTATIAMAMVALSVGGGNLVWASNARKNAELRLSHEEVRRLAALAERERIGRDLHDLLGHTLSLITLKSELANRLFDRDVNAARREVAEVERVARDALAQVRRAVTGIRVAGFAAELASAKLLLEANGVRFNYELADIALPVEIETALAMMVREAVTNAQRHAHASHVRVTLQVIDRHLQLQVEDDGRGGAIVPGNGLAGMRERLAAIGADLSIDSMRGRGTRLCVSRPLPQVPAERPMPAATVLSNA